MTEYRVTFSVSKGVNVEAETEKEAREIVLNGEWDYGMEWDNETTIENVEELP
jgi:hypothetical protein